MSRDERAPAPSLGATASRWIVAIFALAGLIAGLVIFFARPSIYESRTLVSVLNPVGSMGDEAALVESDRVLGTSTTALGFEPELTVEANEVAQLLTLTVRAEDPDEAALAATQLAEMYIRTQTSAAASVASPATADSDPVAPSRMAHILIGSIIGAVLGLLAKFGTSLADRLPVRSETSERPEPIRPARQSGELPKKLADMISPDRSDPDAHEGDPVVRPHHVRPMTGETPAVSIEAAETSRLQSDEVLDLTDDSSDSDEFSTVATTSIHEREGDAEHASSRPRPRKSRHSLSTSTAPSASPTESPAAATAPTSTGQSDIWNDGPGTGENRPDVDSPAATSSNAGPDVELITLVETTGDSPPPGADAEAMAEAVRHAVAAADARLEARLAEQRAVDAEKLASIEGHYERQVDELKREVIEARKQARGALARLKKMDGDDQHRIGDLEAQATALEAEIASLRSQIEASRIDHLKELAAERDSADAALDNARREFRDQLAEHDSTNRASLARSRADLDEILAQARSDHEQALDRQHRDYEHALAAERERRRVDIAKLTKRHRDELATIGGRATQVEAEIKRQTKDTMAELRHSEKRLSDDLEIARDAERAYREEVGQLRAKLRQVQTESSDALITLRDELAVTRKGLETEKKRNAALRDDVVRRTAEAHQAVDRSIDQRSDQLAELEALMTRQREHAEQRIRETNQAAQARLRDASEREVELQARISRLERQLEQQRLGGASQTG